MVVSYFKASFSKTAPHSEWQNGKILGPGQWDDRYIYLYKIDFPLIVVETLVLAVSCGAAGATE